jgi:hypothetical protein
VNKILIDAGKFFAQHFVQNFDHFRIAFHNQSSPNYPSFGKSPLKL